jgi:hypothetical protein
MYLQRCRLKETEDKNVKNKVLRTKFPKQSMLKCCMNSFKSVSGMVGEHCGRLRRYTVRSAGGSTRAYVDTSSEKQGEKPCRRKPKVSCSKVNLLRVSRPLRRG